MKKKTLPPPSPMSALVFIASCWAAPPRPRLHRPVPIHAAVSTAPTGRRVVLGFARSAAVTAAGAALASGCGARAAGAAGAADATAEWYVGAESATVLRWVDKDTIPPGAATAMEAFYTLEFTTYLSRFLLNFDADCAAWWETRMAAIPANLPPDKQTSRRNAAFGAFSASVEYGLRRYPGASGPKALLRSLERQHGSDPEACRHLALAFTFLDERSQPRDDIARLVRRVTAGESGATGTGVQQRRAETWAGSAEVYPRSGRC